MFDADCVLHHSRNKNTFVLKPIDTGKRTNLRDSEQIFVCFLIVFFRQMDLWNSVFGRCHPYVGRQDEPY